MAKFAEGRIEAFNGPAELEAPDNLEQVVVDFVNQARHTLDIAVQELDSEEIAQAIMDEGIHLFQFFCGDYVACIKVFNRCCNLCREIGGIKFINCDNTAITSNDIVP